MRLLIQKLFWASDEGFKVYSFVRRSQTRYLCYIQNWRVIR